MHLRKIIRPLALILSFIFLAWLGFGIYKSTPTSEPPPYPNVTFTTRTAQSVCDHQKIDYFTKEYFVELSLKEVQTYYNDGLRQYCQNNWNWYEGFACKTQGCMESHCNLSDFGHWFNVMLEPVSSTQTHVIQTQYIINYVKDDPKICGE